MDPTFSNAGIAEAEKSPEQLERDMERTREAITEKVAALENQVIDTMQSATDSVTHTVEAVREAVVAAPSAVRDTFREIVDGVKEAINSFSTVECIRSFPGAALGTTVAAGFMAGYFLGSKRSTPPRSMTMRTPMPTMPPPLPRPAAVSHDRGIFSGMMRRLSAECEQLAGTSLTTGMAALKQQIEKQLPNLIEQVVDRVAHFGEHHHAERNGRYRDYGVSAPV